MKRNLSRTAIVALLGLTLVCTVCAGRGMKVLNNSDSVTALQNDVYAISRDDRLKNGNSAQQAEYRGLFDEIPKSGFTVKMPYILFSNKNYQMSNHKDPSYYLLKYSSEGTFNEAALQGAKTLIFADPSYAGEQKYNKVNSSGQNMGATAVYAYKMKIYYYDTESRTIIGFEELAPPSLPEKLPSTTQGLRVSDEEVILAVDKRIGAMSN